MVFLEAFIEVYFTICLNFLLLVAMVESFVRSLDPYAPPEHNLAFLMLSLLPILYWYWAYLTRHEEIKFWQEF